MSKRETHTIVVSPEFDGERADRIVALGTDVSRSVARDLIERGDVGGAATASQRLAAGTELSVRLPPRSPALEPEPIPFDVVYEDDAVIVVMKPAGVVVHPGAGRPSGTLVNGLVDRFPELASLGAEHRWGLVHRLDRDTSGLLMVARSAATHTALQKELKARRVGRSYLALIAGQVSASTGTIDAPIGRDVHHPTRMAVRRDGRPARTHYRRLAEWPDATLLEVTLETGRTHQIRVHLTSIGTPLIGDPTYGKVVNHRATPGRVWLHASRLRFPHPTSGQEIEVATPLPSDLVRSIDVLGPPVRGVVPPDARGAGAQGDHDEDAL